jgi:hypothetical protein
MRRSHSTQASQRRLTPTDQPYRRMFTDTQKVSSDWLPSYFKATIPVLEIFKMAGYFPDGLRNATNIQDGARLLDSRVDTLNTECRGTSSHTVSK